MSQDNKTQDIKEMPVVYKIDDNEIKLTYNIVQQYIVGGDANITMAEFKFFTELCKVQKLNPFMKEAYCIKYSTSVPAQIVVGKDVFLKRAVKHPMYNGKESGIMVMVDGEIKERNGCFFAPGEEVIGGWARVYRKDREHPEFMSVSVAEVAGRKAGGVMNNSWAGKTATMVEKVAKVRALRECFIEELQGMYDEAEFEVPAETPKQMREVGNAPNQMKESAIEADGEVVEQVDISEI